MNEPITTPRRPVSIFAKIYQPAILVLLASILIMQIVSLVSGGISKECETAIASARTVIASQPLNMVADYKSAAYDKAENINQQIFISNEYNFLTLQELNQQQQALLKISSACQ